MAQVHALIHAGQALDGHATVWADARLSKRGRWLRRVWRALRGDDRRARGAGRMPA